MERFGINMHASEYLNKMMACLFIDARSSIKAVSPDHNDYGWEVTLEAAELVKSYENFEIGICPICGMRTPLEMNRCAWGCE